jgi:transcriptional regulator with XRE-family HTH domain
MRETTPLQKLRLSRKGRPTLEVVAAALTPPASAGNLSAIERGEVLVSVRMLSRIADLYGVSQSHVLRQYRLGRFRYLREQMRQLVGLLRMPAEQRKNS